MPKFFVDDVNNEATGPYDTIDEALEDANEQLRYYRDYARFDGWDLDEGDLCIFEVGDDFDPEESEIREGKVVAKVIEIDRRELAEDERFGGFESTCDMKMERV